MWITHGIFIKIGSHIKKLVATLKKMKKKMGEVKLIVIMYFIYLNISKMSF